MIHRHHPSRGVTLIELIVSIGITTLLLGGIYLASTKIFSIGGYLTTSLEEQGQIRKALKEIVPELRSASQSSAGAYPIALASSTAITFYGDIDEDGTKERLRYFLSTSTLWRGYLRATGSPAVYNSANEIVTALVRNVVYSTSTPLFQYFDKNFTGTSTALAQPVNPLTVRLVKITITTDQTPGKPPPAHTGTTQVVIRNLKDNL
jgi:hypothetical protein